MKFLKEGTKGHIEIWYYSIVKIMRTQDISCYLLFWALGNGCPFSLQRKRGEKMNIRTTVYKLQKALLMQGRKIKINQIQAYSPKAGKMITKYIVIESKELKDGRTKNETLLETYSMVDIAKLLALLYRGDDA